MGSLLRCVGRADGCVRVLLRGTLASWDYGEHAAGGTSTGLAVDTRLVACLQRVCVLDMRMCKYSADRRLTGWSDQYVVTTVDYSCVTVGHRPPW